MESAHSFSEIDKGWFPKNFLDNFLPIGYITTQHDERQRVKSLLPGNLDPKVPTCRKVSMGSD